MSFELAEDERTEFLFWKNNSQTIRVRLLIQDEIKKVEESLQSLSGNNENIAKEYYKHVSKIEGLKFIERLFQYDGDETGDSF